MEDKKNEEQTVPDAPDTGEIKETASSVEKPAAGEKKEENPEEKPEEQPKDTESKETEAKSEGKGSEKEKSSQEDKETSAKPESEKNKEKSDGETNASSDDADKKNLFGRKKKDKRDQQIDELNDKVRRQMADFDNFRKRSEKEKSAMYDMGAKSVLEKILPVLDNFERGISSLNESQMDDPFVEGMEKVYRQLGSALDALGVTPIEAVGQPFDPNFHNAVQHVEDEEVGENIVVEEFQKGYLYHDTVLRHSMVKVAN